MVNYRYDSPIKCRKCKKIKEDFWGKQEGRPDVNDFNNGLPRW